MISKQTIELAQKIGQFYLEKNNKDYEKTADEISRLRITEIITISTTMVVIKLSRVGLMIGKRGENFENLSRFIDRKIHLIENTESIEDYLIPYPPDYELDYEPPPPPLDYEEPNNNWD